MRLLSILLFVFGIHQIGFSQRIIGSVTGVEENSSSRKLSTLPAGLIFYEGFDNVVTPNLPLGWETLSTGPETFYTGTSGNSSGQSNENGFWPVPLHGTYALTNDDVCNCNKSSDVLISKTFDLSEHDYIRLGFSAFQNGSNGQSGTLQIRHSGGNWEDALSIPASVKWEDYRITLSTSYLKRDFQFRFKYNDNGGYASGLAVDDVFLSSIPTENFELSDVYTSEVSSSGHMPDLVPKTIAVHSHLVFTGQIDNDSESHKNAQLAVNISGPLDFSDTSSSWLLNSKSVSTIGLPERSTFTPFDSGSYTLNVELLTDSTDTDPTDNVYSETFTVNDSVFQWNTDPLDGTGIWLIDSFDRVGSNIILPSEEELKSAWIQIHPTTEVGARFRVKIFNFNTLTASIFSSSPIQVDAEDIGNWVRVPLSTTLQPGRYLVAVEKESKRLVVSTTAAEKSPEGVSFYKSLNENWVHMGYYPAMQLIFNTMDKDCPGHIQAEISDITCPSLEDGYIAINPIDMTVFRTISWSNGAGDVDSIGGLDDGLYQVFITDGDCTYDRLFEIHPSNNLTINADIQLDSCAKGVGGLTLSTNGSHAPLTFTVNGNESPSEITGLNTGQYSISVQNDLGCSTDTTINLGGSDPITVAINAQTPGCGTSNGKIITSASGTAPFTYSWVSGQSGPTLNGVSSGIYELHVFDSVQCERTITILLADSNAPSISLVDLVDNTCADGQTGSLEIQTTGGTGEVSLLWNTNDTTHSIDQLSKGNYTVTVTDTLGCSSFGNYTIEDLSAPFDIDLLEEGLDCFGTNSGSLDVLVSGGKPPFSYSWNPSEYSGSNISDLPVGSYSVTISDDENCTKSTSTEIISQPKFFYAIDSLVADTSENGQPDAAIYLSTFGGTPPYKFAWSNGSTSEDLIDVDTGFYTVTISDQFGCTLNYEKYLSNDPTYINPISEINSVLYPNPAKSNTTVTIESSIEMESVSIFDIRGNLLINNRPNAIRHEFNINQQGTYILLITDSNGAQHAKRVVIL